MQLSTVSSSLSPTQQFDQLKPACIEVSRFAFLPKESFDPHSIHLLNSLKNLNNVLDTINDPISLKLTDYIFIPITSLLKQESLGHSQTQYILLIIANLLKLSWSKTNQFDQNLAIQLLPIINYLIDILCSEDKNISTFDKFVIVTTSNEYLLALSNQFYHINFFENNSKLLSHLTNILTKLLDILISSTNDHSLQKNILTSLEILYNDLLNFDNGETLSYILPGNISNLTKLLSLPGLNVNYKTVSLTLRVMTVLLVNVYNDFDLNVTLPLDSLHNVSDIISQQNQNDANDSDELKLTIPQINKSDTPHRTTRWLIATRSQIKLAISNIIPKLLKRDNNVINNDLSIMISKLLQTSRKSLNNCQELFIETLLQLQMDPFHELILSENIIIIEKLYNDKLSNLQSIIQLNKINDIKSMEYMISILSQNSNNNMSLTSYTIESTLTKILKCLDTQINPIKSNSILKNNTNIDNENKVIIQSSNVIITDLSVSTKRNFNNQSKQNNTLLPKVDREMGNALTDFIKSLGRNIDLASIIHNILNSYDNDGDDDYVYTNHNSSITDGKLSKRTTTLWMATNLLSFTTNEKQSSKKDESMNDFLDLSSYSEVNASLPNSQENIDDACFMCLEYANDLIQDMNIQTTINSEQERALCTTLFTIETVSIVLQQDFSSELIDYLYPVVENLASASPIVREYAQQCSQTVADILYKGSIQTLLLENVDYLIESISKRLNIGMTERVATVLMVICKMAGYETMLSFKDVIETIFKMLEYYHGYQELCLQFFQFFEVILNEMKLTYTTGGNDISRALGNEHLNKSTFKPWGCQNVEQLISLLDEKTENKTLSMEEELPFEPNEPKSFQEYFNSKLKIHELSEDETDSDDEEVTEEDVGETEKGEDSNDDDENKWISPIPKESYRLIIQIVQYGDRLLTHPSKPLRIQILKVVNIAIPMLATQYDSLLPQVAQIWDSLIPCLSQTDYTIVNAVCNTIKTIVKFSGDFLSRRFIELWTMLQKECPLLREIHSKNNTNNSYRSGSGSQGDSLQRRMTFPPMTRNALVSLSEMLLEGISIAEFTIEETTLTEMVLCCLQVLPAEQLSSRSILLGDIVCYLRNM